MITKGFDDPKTSRSLPNRFNKKKLSLAMDKFDTKKHRIKFMGEIRVKDRQTTINLNDMMECNDLPEKIIIISDNLK